MKHPFRGRKPVRLPAAFSFQMGVSVLRCGLLLLLLCSAACTSFVKQQEQLSVTMQEIRQRHEEKSSLNPNSFSQSDITPRIRDVALAIPGDDPFERLGAAMRMIIEDFAYDPWYNSRQFTRTADQLFQDRTLGGCSDYALVGLALFRAMGYPSLLVVTASDDWIKRYRDNDLSLVYGHSFIEVMVEGRWYLVDPNHFNFFEHYNPEEPWYPRNELYIARGFDFWDLGLRSTADAKKLLTSFAMETTLRWRSPSMREKFKLHFDLPNLFTGLGKVLASHEHDWLALKRYNQALMHDAEYVPAYVGRAAVYLRQVNYEAALKDLNKALELDPANLEAYYYRGLARKGLGDLPGMNSDLGRAAARGAGWNNTTASPGAASVPAL